MTKLETEMRIKQLIKWQQAVNEKLDRLVNGQFPEITQHINSLLTAEEADALSEGSKLKILTEKEGLKIGTDVAKLGVPKVVTPRGIVLLVLAMRGYLTASSQILDELQISLTPKPKEGEPAK